ncbi:hypothetical protein [Paraburkholderia sp. HD33-4]|uniref:hypothetical protein n=1 Tax=Paraburkholderia sp. HD33-4 TaxID=2883242 RepID=UPI001F1C8CC9|nr:hypothetical protein [Paraburkholderia sp. HD33-4]
MSYNDQTAQELAHIHAMILQLEHLVHEGDISQASAVTSPVYWRARITTVLAAADLPPAIKPQIGDLFARLARCGVAQPCTAQSVAVHY